MTGSDHPLELSAVTVGLFNMPIDPHTARLKCLDERVSTPEKDSGAFTLRKLLRILTRKISFDDFAISQ